MSLLAGIVASSLYLTINRTMCNDIRDNIQETSTLKYISMAEVKYDFSNVTDTGKNMFRTRVFF